MHVPRIGITMGDPAGIGPEIIESILQQGIETKCSLVFFADPTLIPSLQKMPHINEAQLQSKDVPHISCFPLSHFQKQPSENELTNEHRKATLSYVDKAADFCLQNVLHGMVTGPLAKQQIAKIAPGFLGHTEFLAQKAAVENVVMLMHSPKLKVALLTTHVALSDVCDLITPKLLQTTIQQLEQSLRQDFAYKKPRIAVTGVNPHCGEGLFGNQDANIVAPTVKAVAQQGIAVTGPHAADTIFWQAARGQYDAVLAMYHDQGLGPVKTLAFEETVNVTLGLPFVRTSVDHGVAYNIAGSGRASASSMCTAIKLAAQICTTRRNNL